MTYPPVFGKLRNPKYPLLISKPKLVETNGQLKQIQDQLKIKGYLPKDIVSIKITEAKNLMIYFTNTDKYQQFLNSEMFMEGEIVELERKLEERCILIKQVNKIDIEDNMEKLKSIGITEIEDLKSRKNGVHINMVKARCSSYEVAEKLIVNKFIEVDYLRLRVVKFEHRASVMVCFNCSGYGHIAKFCRKEKKCVNCSSTEHTKRDCPLNNTDGVRDNLICPRCSENHPATYGGCIKLKEAIKRANGNNVVPSNTRYMNYAESIKNNEMNEAKKLENQLTKLIIDNQKKMEESNAKLEAKIDELVSLNKEVTGLKAKIATLENENKKRKESQDNIISFINSIWKMLAAKNKTLDTNDYKSKLLYYFNSTLDSSGNLKSQSKPTAKNTKDEDMFDFNV